MLSVVDFPIFVRSHRLLARPKFVVQVFLVSLRGTWYARSFAESAAVVYFTWARNNTKVTCI
jgi:nitric oxide reductase large subunit